MPHRIAIIGAGFSGTVLAAHLLRQNPRRQTTVLLIERGPAMGRGLAYAKRDWPYLLNVPAGRLSTDSREPMQFLRFAQQSHPNAGAEDFLARELYGDYLQDVLRRAEEGSPAQIELTRITGEVVRLSKSGDDLSLGLHMADGDLLSADQVVLAVGNPSPGTMPWAREVHGHAAYRADPWMRVPGIGSDKTVVIVGNGLTMADVTASLAGDIENAPRIVSISRHGLMPLPQSQFHAAAPGDMVASALAGVDSIRELLAVIRRLASESTSRGGDWREVITSIRGVAPRLWQRLPHAERRRFLRHVRSFWDVHRHRLPTELADRIDCMRRAGKLQVNAGRIVGIKARGHQLEVTWRGRGNKESSTVQADLVVNATGPELSLGRSSDALLKSLRGEGWIAEDDLSLGMRTVANGACVDVAGATNQSLYYLGPMLRAEHWEATAATELRDHAARLATYLLEAT